MRARSIKLPPGSRDDAPHRAHNDLEIQPQRPLVNVLKIHVDPIVEVVDVVTAIDLPQAGYPWPDAQLTLLPELVTLELVSERGPWPDKAHIAFQDTVQLR